MNTNSRNVTYSTVGDYQLPNLILNQPRKPLGKYGRLRRTYLKEQRPILWNSLLLSEKLFPHLSEIEQTAQRRLAQLMKELPEAQGVNESLKASDPMKWVGLMNNCKAQAEEMILTELIYS